MTLVRMMGDVVRSTALVRMMGDGIIGGHNSNFVGFHCLEGHL